MTGKDEFLDLKKAKIEPIALDEIFVQVHNTHNYWVSNYGRVVNNLKSKDEYYIYKTGNVHLTLTSYYMNGERVPKDTYIKNLVAEHFLFKQKGKENIYFIDGNKENNYYKNLVLIDGKELYAIKNGIACVDEFVCRQEYIDYTYKGSQRAREGYNTMYKRTHDKEFQKYFPQYADAVRRHIVGGTNRTLISVILPPRLHSPVGDRRLLAGQPHAVVALFCCGQAFL